MVKACFQFCQDFLDLFWGLSPYVCVVHECPAGVRGRMELGAASYIGGGGGPPASAVSSVASRVSPMAAANSTGLSGLPCLTLFDCANL